MIDSKFSFDTNLLVYAVDSSDSTKHKLTIALLDKIIPCNCVLTLQSLCEFYYVVTRKGHLSTKLAKSQLADWQLLFPTVIAKASTLHRALSVIDIHKLSFWDAMLWATAREAGVTILLSEDFQHNQTIDTVRIINPFIMSDLSELLSPFN